VYAGDVALGLLAVTTFIVVASCSGDSAMSRRVGDSSPEGGHPPRHDISFEADVLPILSDGCRPCHFEGGKMHQMLPFDRPETIRKLGERLFTRLRDEEDRAVVREFLAAGDDCSPRRVPRQLPRRGDTAATQVRERHDLDPLERERRSNEFHISDGTIAKTKYRAQKILGNAAAVATA
jgi:hypothetical protein